jgi:hypothetical protein
MDENRLSDWQDRKANSLLVPIGVDNSLPISKSTKEFATRHSCAATQHRALLIALCSSILIPLVVSVPDENSRPNQLQNEDPTVTVRREKIFFSYIQMAFIPTVQSNWQFRQAKASP